MSDIAIKVENLSKQYRLGEIGTGTISRDLERWWYKVRGKEDPFLKIGDTNDRTIKGESDYVWALKDINFEVKKGEVLGIIGRNGAGKSTLLKILSSTTTPTTGQIKIQGKIASLLEVGTGFHPDLSGRDNIYLNGAILGMNRKEIKAKFEEIVDFAGVERYIDTPVKRYSSGMYVRLAFGVAAHLEPDILIVDEVLAVGDAEFQKKCLGKMKEVSVNQGRTVLFVSHNISAISELCSKAMLLKNGCLSNYEVTSKVIENYLIDNSKNFSFENQDDPTKPFGQINKIELMDENQNKINSFSSLNKPIINVIYTVKKDAKNFNIGYSIFDSLLNHIYSSSNTDLISDDDLIKIKRTGTYFAEVNMPLYNLNTGNYILKVIIGEINIKLYDSAEINFSILNRNFLNTGVRPGIMISINEWKIVNK